MKNIGIIAEYNPLHNGHIYHINKVKDENNNIIVAMSGNFTERGDIAVANKYTRARHAIENGADMVIEIPVFGVLSCAEHFAKCAVKVLTLLNNINEISFGSECGDISLLTKISEATDLVKNSEVVRRELANGVSYPKAISNALKEIINTDIDTSILSSPNNILAIEYIDALKETNILPSTIKRVGGGYNDTSYSNHEYASATAIRNNIKNKEISPYLPEDVLNSITNIDINPNKLFDLIYYKLSVESCNIDNIINIGEGIDNRFKKAVMTSNSYESLINNVKSKRYTLARIKRTVLDILLGIEKNINNYISSIDYVTVLAVKQSKLPLLRDCKSNIITKYKDYNKTDHPYAVLDKKSNELYNLLSSDTIKNGNMLIIE